MSFVKLPVLRHGLMVRDEEILPDSVVAARIAKTRALMSEKNVQCLLVYGDPLNNAPVSFLTNYPLFGMGRRATVVLGAAEGPFLFTAEPSRNLPKVRRLTTCDLEKTRKFLPMGSERARELTGKGRLGLVGLANLPAGLVKDTAALDGAQTLDLDEEMARLAATKDVSTAKAQARACTLAEEGIKLLQEHAADGKDLWELAAFVDYHLRLKGCEDTNILVSSSAGEWMRPRYPARKKPRSGEKLIAYVAVQCARQWGAVGRTMAVGPADAVLEAKMALLAAARQKAVSAVKAGMTIGGVKAALGDVGRQAGLALAGDLEPANGIGFDLAEYPREEEERVEKDMVLQISLCVDFPEGFTGMIIDMLKIAGDGSVWLTGKR